MKWLEVSLIVDGEMAEAVAEVLARFAPSGVVIESTAIRANVEDEGHPVGPLKVCAYLELDDQIEETRYRIEESLWYLGRIRELPEPVFSTVEEVNWAEAWKQHYKPVSIGERLIIIPAWLESPEKSRTSIRIDPGMAFGTGTHPTTQLCLEIIDKYLGKPTRFFEENHFKACDVIDVGCGSGILSIAALKLGAARAYGVDVEPDAIPAAQDNAASNSVADRYEIALGSVDEVKAGIFEIQHAKIVLANILAPVLMRLLTAGLDDLVSPGGILILSGILEEQIDEMLSKIKTHNLNVIELRQIDDWIALVLSR